MQTGKELFIHELTDILDAERRILEGLEKQMNESTNPQLQQLFEQHHSQTEGQIERLEQCFEELDEEAEDTECRGIMGLLEEHEEFTSEEEPAEDILDVFNVGAARKIEAYEITAYTALINMAEQMEQKKIVRLLNQNLKEELQTAKKLEGMMKKIKPENLEEPEEEMSADSEEEQGGRGQSRRNQSRGRQAQKKSGRSSGRKAA